MANRNDDKSLFIDSMTLRDDDANTVEGIDDLRFRLSNINNELSSLSEQLAKLEKEKAALLDRIVEFSNSGNTIAAIKKDEYSYSSDYSSIDKARIFLDIFGPNREVYAVRGYRYDIKRANYYPRCNNFRQFGCAKLNGLNCKECKIANYAKLTKEVVKEQNFKNIDPYGIGAIGIYLMKNGNVVHSAAIDLDEASWKEDAMSILKVARAMGISMAWERSFSGNGAHLWVFFKDDILASDARKLLFSLLDKTRESNPRLSLSSYDRIFPSQDRLSKGGIGNLILLPLVYSAAEKGNTLFLDDYGVAYPLSEQIEYLLSIHKHTYDEVKSFLRSDSDRFLKLDEIEEDEINPDWIKRIPKLSKSDFNGDLVFYLSTGITFDKKVLSQSAIESFRRLATIYNPEYFKMQAKYDGYHGAIKSRIPLYEENERVLKLPRGLISFVMKILDSIGIEYKIEDHRICNTDLDVSFKEELKPEQETALKAILKRECGILSGGTGFGKTAVALALIAERKERTMIIVNSKNLLEQWRAEIEKFLEITTFSEVMRRKKVYHESVGILGGNKNTLTGIVDIVTLQSISSRFSKGDFDFALRYGLVIVDECHHIAAENSRDVLKNLNSKYVYGLSATPKRHDGLEKIVFSECGYIAFSYSSAKLARLRGIEQRYIVRFLKTILPRTDRKRSFSEVLDSISCDGERSNLIAEDIAAEYSRNRKILVFTRRLEQNRMIEKCLNDRSITTIVLDGNMKPSIIAQTIKMLKTTTDSSVLIATDKLLGEGMDIPGLDTLFLVSPYMQEGVLQQCAGRLSRASKSKTNTLIYDYVDYRIPILSRMFTRRLSIYKKLGYQAIEDVSIPYERLLYDDCDFDKKLLDDICNAKTEIVISSSLILPSKITKQLFAAISDAKNRGIAVILKGNMENCKQEITKAIYSICDEIGLSVLSVESPKNFVAIDREICWYGELNPLGVTTKMISSDKRFSIMRIVDRETALCLITDDELLV